MTEGGRISIKNADGPNQDTMRKPAQQRKDDAWTVYFAKLPREKFLRMLFTKMSMFWRSWTKPAAILAVPSSTNGASNTVESANREPVADVDTVETEVGEQDQDSGLKGGG